MEQVAVDLWQRYKKYGDMSAREELVKKYIHLVKYVCNRIVSDTGGKESELLRGSVVDKDDLHSSGVLGLLDAIEKFDPDRGVKFITYAIPRIRGSVIDELRSIDWIPRTLRKRIHDLEQAYYELESKLLRPATESEIREKMDVSREELDTILLAANRTCVLSLEEELSFADMSEAPREETIEDKNVVDSREQLELNEVTEILADAVASLPEKERLVTAMYYYDEMTFKEIGEVLNLTESRICQLHTSAMMRLKARLKDHQNDLVV